MTKPGDFEAGMWRRKVGFEDSGKSLAIGWHWHKGWLVAYEACLEEIYRASAHLIKRWPWVLKACPW